MLIDIRDAQLQFQTAHSNGARPGAAVYLVIILVSDVAAAKIWRAFVPFFERWIAVW